MMSGFVVWLYVIIGQVTVLVALSDDESAEQMRWLAQRGGWLPYVGTVVMVLAWPAAAPFLLLFPKKR
jgi:uncharacterized membrane protein YdjX (TVP38/TMEM64 family)